MNTKLLEGVRYINDSLNSFSLEYYLIKSEDLIDMDYGVEIIKRVRNNEKDIAVETDGCYTLTKDCDQAKEIVNILIKNKVTPVTLEYILEDLIEEILI